MRNIVLFFALIAVALAADRCAVTNPIDCGFPGMLWFVICLSTHPGIGQNLCETRGCCYVDGASPSCYYPDAGQVNITKVHIVHGCHFDAGYVDDLYIIINRYFDTFFPAIHDVFRIECESFVFRKVCEERLRVIIQWNSLLILIWFICSSTALQIPRFIVLMKYAFIILADV